MSLLSKVANNSHLQVPIESTDASVFEQEQNRMTRTSPTCATLQINKITHKSIGRYECRTFGRKAKTDIFQVYSKCKLKSVKFIVGRIF